MSGRLLIGLLLLGSLVAVAGAPGPLARFDHADHVGAFAREGLACIACHPMGQGDPANAAADERMLTAVPEGACHYCHTDDQSIHKRAPSRCATCHDSVEPPPTHAAGWLADHGAVARMRDCSDCHENRDCIDCHERRDAVRYTVHDRGWLGVHGMAVLADPASCGSCHRHDFCTACHSGGMR